MAVGDETIGLGATVEIDDNGNGSAPDQASFEEVEALLTITPPSIKTGVAESKRIGATRIRKVATIEDGAEWSFTQDHTHAGWTRMETIREAKYRCTYRITVPDDDGDTEIEVVAIILENKIVAMESDKITEFETMLAVAE